MPTTDPDAEPHPRRRAWTAVARCVATSVGMIRRGEVRLARGRLGRQLHFGDGTTAMVYRETVVPGRTPLRPCFLAVSFRLRYVRGRGHAVFRAESLLNTPLFVGFPGFVSKLWLAHDGRGRYRGLYEWEGADAAADYARSLWRVLELVSEPGSIDFRVLGGVRRDDVVDHPLGVVEGPATGEGDWWRVTAPPTGPVPGRRTARS